MKLFGVLTVLLFVMFLAVSANAFDYERKGFVIGVGAGYSPLMKGSWGEPAVDFDDQSGLAVDFLIGYAWNNRNMLLYLVSGGGYEDTLNVYYGGTLIHQNEIQYSQGFSGVAFRHYFSAEDRSLFATVGLGFEVWVPSELDYCHRGIGFLLGGGYEFIKHFQISGNYSFGYTQSKIDFDYNHSQITLTLTGVLY